jgi:hypothetical protein
VSCQELASAAESKRKELSKTASHLEDDPGLKLFLIDVGDGLRPDDASRGRKAVGARQIQSAPFLPFWDGLAHSDFDRAQNSNYGLTIVSEEQLKLNLWRGTRHYTLDAYQFGDPEGNYIFTDGSWTNR